MISLNLPPARPSNKAATNMMVQLSDADKATPTMPCLSLTPNDRVTDIDAAYAGANNSRFRDMMKCLFVRKKKQTEVVDMTQDTQTPVAKKQTLTLDRSERSRRLLKMESMKAAPLNRNGATNPVSRATSFEEKRFLPSEQPAAALMSYLNPRDKSIRRACSDAVRSSSDQSAKSRLTREAFVRSSQQSVTRNTNYRAQRQQEKPPEKPERMKRPWEKNMEPPPGPGVAMDTGQQQQQQQQRRYDMFVPGSFSYQDENQSFPQDQEIDDLHEEMKRMKLTLAGGRPRVAAAGSAANGAHGVSGSADPGDQEVHKANGVTEGQPDDDSYRGVKNKGMESAIDALYLQTKQKIDHIYQDGLETIASYRGDHPNVDELLKPRSLPAEETIAPAKKVSKQEPKSNAEHTNSNGSEPVLDSLLTEVTEWAKDRQQWVLGQARVAGSSKPGSDCEDNDSNAVDQVAVANSSPAPTKKLVSVPVKGGRASRLSFRNTGMLSIGGEHPTSDTKKNNAENNSTYVSVLDNGDAEEEEDIPVVTDEGRYTAVHVVQAETWCDDIWTSCGGHREQFHVTADRDGEMRVRQAIRPASPDSPDSWLSDDSIESGDESEAGQKPNDESLTTVTPLTASNDIEDCRKIRVKESKNIKTFQLHPHISNTSQARLNTPMPRDKGPMHSIGHDRKMVKNTQLQPLQPVQNGHSEKTPKRFTFTAQQTLSKHKPNKVNGFQTNKSFLGATNLPSAPKNATMRPFSEIPLRTTDPLAIQNNRNNHFMMAAVNRHQTDSMAEPQTTVQRPVSETVAPRRTDMIGMGHVMATDSTKERAKYARGIVNAMQQNRLVPDSAFPDESKPTVEPETTPGGKVMDKRLLTGGYSYDRHSRVGQGTRANMAALSNGADTGAGVGTPLFGVGSSADRLKQQRRREQEKGWLMQDAAETEV